MFVLKPVRNLGFYRYGMEKSFLNVLGVEMKNVSANFLNLTVTEYRPNNPEVQNKSGEDLDA